MKKYELDPDVLRNALINKMEDDHLVLLEDHMIAYVPTNFHELMEYTTDAKLKYLELKG